MTAADPGTSPSPSPSPTPSHAAEEAAVDRFASLVPIANPALIGVPTFLVGSIALALQLTDYVPQALVGGPIAIIFAATGIGQTIATIFALRAGESSVASVFGIFAGFWLSYSILVLGILHNWFGFTTPPPTATTKAEVAAAAVASVGDGVKLFLLTWLILVAVLTLVSLRLPLAFTVLFVLVVLALLFVYLAYVNADAMTGAPSSGQLKTGGYFAWAFIVVGAYLFADAFSAATGGKNFPLGPAVIK